MANTENQLILITDVAVGKFQEMLFKNFYRVTRYSNAICN